MRLTLLAMPVLLLGACAAPPQTSSAPADAQVGATEPFVIFDVPMDPGQIRCASLTNPAALDAAVQWTIGQARAGVLAGRVTEMPDESNLKQTFATYCPANPDSTVRAAATLWGLAA